MVSFNDEMMLDEEEGEGPISTMDDEMDDEEGDEAADDLEDDEEDL